MRDFLFGQEPHADITSPGDRQAWQGKFLERVLAVCARKNLAISDIARLDAPGLQSLLRKAMDDLAIAVNAADLPPPPPAPEAPPLPDLGLGRFNAEAGARFDRFFQAGLVDRADTGRLVKELRRDLFTPGIGLAAGQTDHDQQHWRDKFLERVRALCQSQGMDVRELPGQSPQAREALFRQAFQDLANDVGELVEVRRASRPAHS